MGIMSVVPLNNKILSIYPYSDYLPHLTSTLISPVVNMQLFPNSPIIIQPIIPLSTDLFHKNYSKNGTVCPPLTVLKPQ